MHTQCNNSAIGNSAACQYGWLHDLNKSCAQIIASNNASTSKYYYINSSQTVATNRPCYFVGTRVATAIETITECNRTNTTGNIACRYGYDNAYNNTCDNIVLYDTSRTATTNTVTAANSVEQKCCSCCETPIGSSTIFNASTALYPNTVRQIGEIIACTGIYRIELRGEQGMSVQTYNYTGAHGGIAMIDSLSLNKGQSMIFKSISGRSGGVYATFEAGGAGVGFWLDNTLIMVAGGGVNGGVGGGGYLGGWGWNNLSGWNWDGSRSAQNKTLCTSVNCSAGAAGGGVNDDPRNYFYGGSGYCRSGYTCIQIPGGNQVGSTEYLSSEGYGNEGRGSANITYLGEP